MQGRQLTGTVQGSLFGPYTPLQQLDVLADHETKSYIVGSTNSLLLQQRDRYSDILINLDEDFINITSPSLKQALQLSTPDRRWIDFITQTVNETWDDANPSRPKTMGFMGSEEFIRLQFEDYVVALLSSVKYHNFMLRHKDNPKMFLPHIEGDPAADFNLEWVEAWMKTENYRIWNSHTDGHLFDIVEPRHICAGGLTIDDVSRRVTQQVAELHLDEKLAVGKEVAARNWAAAREKGGTMIGKFYAELESYREAQRKKAEETKQQQQSESVPASPINKNGNGQAPGERVSWAAWAGEKRKAWATRGSGDRSSGSSGITGAGGGWGLGLGRSKSKRDGSSASSTHSTSEWDVKSPRMSTSSSFFSRDKKGSMERAEKPAGGGEEEDGGGPRPGTHHSFSESILGSEGGSEEAASSPEASPQKPRIDFATQENGVWTGAESPAGQHRLA